MLQRLLDRHMQTGTLELCLPNGKSVRGGRGTPELTWVIKRWRAVQRLVRNYEYHLGETYMNGDWHTEPGTLSDLITLLMRNFPEQTPRGVGKIVEPVRQAVRQWNPITRSIRNVRHHYEIDAWLYRQFLDEELHYSCAYFDHPTQSIESAQQYKCQRIHDKLCLQAGQSVLDVGCGWGGLAIYLAQHADVQVTGVTLSQEQLEVARARANAAHISDRVHFELMDYRQLRGGFDRIVSVGMFEHVGRPNYAQFFGKLTDLLSADGVALLHTIGRLGPPSHTNPWIQRHIFPGGYVPALSEIIRAMESHALISTDVEILREHYALTLDHWLARFTAHKPQVVARMGERFFRMWEFYLAVCAAAFRWRDLAVFQVQFAKALRNPVPITRHYLHPHPAGVDPAAQIAHHSEPDLAAK